MSLLLACIDASAVSAADRESAELVPLVDALRTRLLAPAPEMVETLDRCRFSAHLLARLPTVS
jgi:hypothetical protein